MMTENSDYEYDYPHTVSKKVLDLRKYSKGDLGSKNNYFVVSPNVGAKVFGAAWRFRSTHLPDVLRHYVMHSVKREAYFQAKAAACGLAPRVSKLVIQPVIRIDEEEPQWQPVLYQRHLAGAHTLGLVSGRYTGSYDRREPERGRYLKNSQAAHVVESMMRRLEEEAGFSHGDEHRYNFMVYLTPNKRNVRRAYFIDFELARD